MSLMKKKREGVVRFSSQHLRIADYLVNYREECIIQGPLHRRAYA